MSAIRTIIIDDEPAAVRVLELLLHKIPDAEVEVIGATNDPLEGRDLIVRLQPDLVFLDIEMPNLSGIELVRSLPDPDFHVVFVTAYDTYALEALRLSALDYLLKPVDRNQVGHVVRRVQADRYRKQSQIIERLEFLEKQLAQRPAGQPKIAVGMAEGILFLPVGEILYGEAQGSYTRIHMRDGQTHLASKSLGHFEEYLRPYRFFRIHHHFLINLDRVRSFQRTDGGSVVMEDGRPLDVAARRYREFLEVIRERMI